ncbi:MAG TPA: hypothetical protein PKD64_11260 [Pirellulaceae bacterium]|nr:hypothetical protein [Pirellulaceae bacterium]HMP69342.1 hypothetical protein [Pirellulaceae bacterium]
MQLPTIEVFNINTAVMVPDGGMTYLGGVGRVRYGSNTVGVPGLSNIPGMNRLFKNRGIGHDISSSNAAVTAKIIILEELEQEVLAEAKRRQASRAHQAELEKEADRISNQIGRSRK